MKKILTFLLALSLSAIAMADTTLSVGCGQQVQISASALTGYHFVRWSDGSTDNPRYVTASVDSTLKAFFAVNQYEVKFINYDGTVLQTTTYNYGDTPTYIGATPTKPSDAQNTYTFSGWSPTISTVTAEATYTAQFTASAINVTITAVSSDPAKGYVSGGGQYQIGSNATLTATPTDACFEFEQWSDGDTSNPRTVSVTADATYTAIFRQLQYTFVVESDNNQQGTVNAVLVP